MESELFFEELCASIGISCERVPPSARQAERRPDYVIVGKLGSTIYVEVKQFDPAPDEAEVIRRIAQGEVLATGGMPGARMRKAIADAGPQLKSMCAGRFPGLVVVWNNVPHHWHHTDPYDVLVAMRGLDVVPVVVSRDPRVRPTFLPRRPGPKKKMTATANTTISAVAILPGAEGWDVGFRIFHNKYAKVPLLIGEITGPAVQHLVMSADEDSWEPAA